MTLSSHPSHYEASANLANIPSGINQRSLPNEDKRGKLLI